jgi:hypothetical protein
MTSMIPLAVLTYLRPDRSIPASEAINSRRIGMSAPRVGQYKHSPLKHHSSVRLLTLLPGDFGTPFRWHMSEYEKGCTPPYEALS